MLVDYAGHRRSIFRRISEFGYDSFDLASLPRRVFSANDEPPLVEPSVDCRRVKELPTPAKLLAALPEGENWLSTSARTISALHASFLLAEDPQGRLDHRKAATLMHQVSLVQHILSRADLRRVLIGDEVGLGKTIEAGLLIRQFIDRNPLVRVLYLAPARLVRNVVSELRNKLDIDARRWVAGTESDARLSEDRVIVASIHKSVFNTNFEKVVQSGPWDVLIVDECHHLSDWDPAGGKPNRAFDLVSKLRAKQPQDGRLILLSGTPHQGNEARFQNLLRLLSDDGKTISGAAGRVIFRTKDRVRDWRGAPLFPSREIRQPCIVQLGDAYQQWYEKIGELYDTPGLSRIQMRATGWAKGQALQWAASSLQAGLGFLVRLAMRRLNWTLAQPELAKAIEVLRPYRGGPRDEPVTNLFQRIQKQVGLRPEDEQEFDDAEELDDGVWRPDPQLLAALLTTGVQLLHDKAAVIKWDAVCRLIEQAGDEKVVLFAQPVETVTVVAELLEERFNVRPSIIIGNQSENERLAQVQNFMSDTGPRFLVSSRAGGEGLNMQKARRLIHLDVPWNPMDLEQRIGRVHRFGSRKTVIVDTVVAAGCREVDMYRIAREKLKLIAQQLDPEQFEQLFSRVMSLIPPKELENILGNVASFSGFNESTASEIGRLVKEGFLSWNSFDEEYRKRDEEIRAASPGEARWSDLSEFLIKNSDAERVVDAHFTAFEARGDEIVDIDETVHAIRIDESVYACGDTGGLAAQTLDGKQVSSIGLNLENVQALLRKILVPEGAVGVACVRRTDALEFLPKDSLGGVFVFATVRQLLRQERGLWTEQALSLHVYTANENLTVLNDLNSSRAALVVRECVTAQRVRDPKPFSNSVANLLELESKMFNDLRRPSEKDIQSGLRYAVWPTALIYFTP